MYSILSIFRFILKISLNNLEKWKKTSLTNPTESRTNYLLCTHKDLAKLGISNLNMTLIENVIIQKPTIGIRTN